MDSLTIIRNYLKLKYGNISNACQKLGVTPRTFRNWAKGITKIPLEKALLLAYLTALPVKVIFNAFSVSQTVEVTKGLNKSIPENGD